MQSAFILYAGDFSFFFELNTLHKKNVHTNTHKKCNTIYDSVSIHSLKSFFHWRIKKRVQRFNVRLLMWLWFSLARLRNDWAKINLIKSNTENAFNWMHSGHIGHATAKAKIPPQQQQIPFSLWNITKKCKNSTELFVNRFWRCHFLCYRKIYSIQINGKCENCSCKIGGVSHMQNKTQAQVCHWQNKWQASETSFDEVWKTITNRNGWNDSTRIWNEFQTKKTKKSISCVYCGKMTRTNTHLNTYLYRSTTKHTEKSISYASLKLIQQPAPSLS